MVRGNFSSFYGTATAGQEMVDVLKANAEYPKEYKGSTEFTLRKVAINGTAGMAFKLNGKPVILPSSGVFETPVGLFPIESLVFDQDSVVNICYLY